MSNRNTTENTAVSTIIMSRGFSTDHSTPSMLRRYLSLKSFETSEDEPIPFELCLSCTHIADRCLSDATRPCAVCSAIFAKPHDTTDRLFSFSGKVESILYALYATLADVVRQIPYFRRLAAGWQGSSHVG